MSVELKKGMMYRSVHVGQVDFVFYIVDVDDTKDFPMRSIDIIDGKETANGWHRFIDEDTIEVLGHTDEFPEYFL